MFVVDANVLLYAVNQDSPQHREARDWLDPALAGPEPVAFATIVVLAFLRLATRRDIFERPLSTEQACRALAAWRSGSASVSLDPSPDHEARLCALLDQTGSGGNLVSDAHLAALALGHRDATVVTFDRDFARFSGIKVHLLGA